MGGKKPGREAEPPSKRRIAWPGWTGFRGMTVRDWLQLLIIPFALVILGFLFTMQQNARQQKIENQRAEAEQELAVQRAQDEALQAYLGQMNSLLLENDLRESKEDSEVRTLARARTLTTLSRLDSSRKTAVIDFLVVARLIQKVKGVGAIVKLDGADLGGVDLSDAGLSDADLSGVSLSDADLSSANLRGANLRGANLSNAGLEATDLSDADLSGANLLRANLFGADLSDADLSGASLSDADLSGANLSDADLGDANLFGANLFAAQGISNEQLKEQVSSLAGATMLNGQKYEDWHPRSRNSRHPRRDLRRSVGQATDQEPQARG